MLNYSIIFSLNSASGLSVTKESETLPNSDDFPPYIADNFNLYNLQYLMDTIYKYFIDMTPESKQDSIIQVNDAIPNINAIIEAFYEVMNNAEWVMSEKVPSDGALPAFESNIGPTEIVRLQVLFLELYSQAVNDPNVEMYSKNFLSKAIVKLNEPRLEMGKGNRLKKLFAFINSGIRSNALEATKIASIELEKYIIQLFPGSIEKFPDLRSRTANLKKRAMVRSVNEDRYNILNGGNLQGQKLRTYVNDTVVQINNMNIREQNVNPPSSFGKILALGLIKSFRESGLRKTVVQGTTGLIATTMSANPKLKSTYQAISELNIYSTETEGEIYVNFSGNLGDTPIGGSYSISANSIMFPSYNGYFNAINLNNNTKIRLAERIGSLDTSNPSIWRAYLVFLFSYLSIMVYCALNPDNIFGVDIDLAGRENLNFMIQPDFMNEIIIEFKEALKSQPPDIVRLVSYSMPFGWVDILFSKSSN